MTSERLVDFLPAGHRDLRLQLGEQALDLLPPRFRSRGEGADVEFLFLFYPRQGERGRRAMTSKWSREDRVESVC